MRADEMFKKYHEMKEELSMVSFQLAHFKGIPEEELIEAMSFSHPDSDERVQTSTTSDKTAKIALCVSDIVNRESDEWYKFLIKRYRELDDEVSFFEHCIKRLGDKKYSVVMDILEGEMTYDQIAVVNQVGRTTVANYRKEAIAEMNEQYDRREKQQIAFMLS